MLSVRYRNMYNLFHKNDRGIVLIVLIVLVVQIVLVKLQIQRLQSIQLSE